MKLVKLFIAVVLLFSASSAFALDEIRDLTDLKVPSKVDGGAFTLNEVKMAIMQACNRRNWNPDAKGGNEIMASLMNRGHIVVVTITFDTKSYAVKYHSSQNMDYDEKKHKIHKKYNAWVANLVKEINNQLFQKSLSK